MAIILSGGTPRSIRWATRPVRVLVLPDPAPAIMRSGPFGWLTAWDCLGLRSDMIRAILIHIGTLLKKPHNFSISAVLAVVFFLAGIAANVVFGSTETLVGSSQVAGGPELAEILAAEHDNLAPAGFYDSTLANPDAADLHDPLDEMTLVDGDSLLTTTGPAGGFSPLRDGIINYIIKKGDTLSGIASQFQISVNTLLWANSSLRSRSLIPGQEILVLPVAGVLHRVSEGETVSGIARTYGIDEAKVRATNVARLARGPIASGDMLIIPGGSPRTAVVGTSGPLPNLDGYFGLPAAGFNWGKVHFNNAVDVANACGTPVYAMAEGLVSEVLGPQQWNYGYGGLVGIEHPNKTSTRYAHLQKTKVQVGDYIKKGTLIGEMGNTGNVRGTTGCHVHVEVIGAHNPLAKQ